MPVEQRHSDSDSDPFERELSAALHHAGADFDTDRAALAAAGTVRGRRLRQRRRAAVLGGAAGVVLVGVGGALAVDWGGGPGAPPRAPPAAAPAEGRAAGGAGGLGAERVSS
ncbi:hypothetical protein ACFWIJ_04915, partial [Streptomyces sp. NPDC127079]